MNCTPPLSSHNQYSILPVDNTPEIDEPIENPKVVQPPESVPKMLAIHQRKWEKRLPAHFVIDALDEMEGSQQSLTLKIELQTIDTGEVKSVCALLDSGATGMFIDRGLMDSPPKPSPTRFQSRMSTAL